MNRVLAAGGGLTALGMVGYGIGITEAYPGRAFSLTAIMIGVTITVIGYWGASAGRQS